MRENKFENYKLEVHVAGICFRETKNDVEVLIAKRRENRSLYPNKWECGGGSVHPGENFEEAVKREMRDELGVIVDRVKVFGTYEIVALDIEQKKIPGIKFICFWKNYANGKEPEIDPQEFSEWKWQSVGDLYSIDFIDGIDKDIKTGWEFYDKFKNVF